MAEPRVSVVVIFWNAGAFLAEAIASIERQCFTSWELLLVDDGSTDSSSAIAQAAAARDPERVRVLTHEGRANRGMSASRNLGIAQARGEFLAFLDGDDVWLPERLEHHVRLLDEHPGCGMVAGPTQLWFSWGRPEAAEGKLQANDRIRDLAVPVNTELPAPGYLVDVLEDRAKTPAMCSFTVRTAAARECGGFDADFRGMFEDQVFLAKILMRQATLVTPRCLDRYRQHPDSACYQARLRGHYHGTHNNPDQRAFVQRLSELLRDLPVSAPALVRAVERWQFRFRHPIRTMLSDAIADPRRSLRIALRRLAEKTLPRRLYERVWARAQGFAPNQRWE